jgi:diguanylate cyclase (GGDEF)-like protein
MGVQPEHERTAMARYGAYLFGSGGTLGLLSLAAPHNPQVDELGVLVTSLVALLAATVSFLGRGRIPAAGVHALLALGTVLISSGIYFGGMSPTPQILFYIWNSLFVFYFFSRRAALLHVAFIAAAYALVLVLIPPAFPPVANWVITVGTVAVAGVFVYLLKARLQAMVWKLADAARTDPLTGLLNRRGLQERMGVEVARARRERGSLAAIALDVDHFKDVNDRHGHEVGDRVITWLGATIREHVRGIDIAARLGGDEFAVVMVGAGETEALSLAERIRTAVGGARDRERFGIPAGLRITVSTGVAASSAPAGGGGLLAAADAALYGAKRAGRDRTVVHAGGGGSRRP